jgi:hypothetical protein
MLDHRSAFVCAAWQDETQWKPMDILKIRRFDASLGQGEGKEACSYH